MSYASAVTWMSWLAAVAGAVTALELAWVWRAWQTGPFAWPPPGTSTASRVAAAVFGVRGTAIAIAALLGSALALPWTDGGAPAWIAAASALALSIRFGGAYNGGSDAMLWLVLVGLALARTSRDDDVGRAGLAYVAAQLALSYIVAGVAKLGDARWRDASALAIVARIPRYGVPAWIQRAFARPWLGRPAAWAMLAFELGFVLVAVDPRVCGAFALVGIAFHVANAIAFGLNRFLWAWLAAYPALLYWFG